MKVFITGGTGFLGKKLVLELAKESEKIYILTRKGRIPEFENLSNVILIKGDITSPEVVLNAADRKIIRDEVTHVIHAAAFYDLQASHNECYLQNVVGTQNVLHFLKSIDHLKSFFYVSTIAVGDDQNDFLEENSLPVRHKFSDHYSKTKYLAESLVRDFSSQLNCKMIIMRPGIIVGDSQHGVIEKIDGPYYFINAFKKYHKLLQNLKIAPLGFNPHSKIPIIPVDHCAFFILLIIKRENQCQNLDTFHLISDEIPSVQEFLDDLKQIFNLKTRFIPIPKNVISDSLLKMFGIPKEVIPFMFSKLSYDKTVVNRVIPEISTSKYLLYKDALLKK